MTFDNAMFLVAAIYADTTENGVVQRAKLESLLTERPQFSDFIARLIAITETEGGYNWVSPRVNSVNFPTAIEPYIDGAQLKQFSACYQSILIDLEASGRRAANAAETLLYGIQNPEDLQKRSILGLGQIWIHQKTGVFAVILYTERNRRRVKVYNIRYLGPEYGSIHILTLPMTAVEIARRDAKIVASAVTVG